MGFPTKNDHFGVFWGYHNLRKHPYGCQLLLTRKSLVKHRSYWLICRILVCIHLSSGYLIRDIQQMNILSYFSSRNTFLYTRVKVDATVYIYINMHISPVLTYLLGTVFSHVLWPFSRNQIFFQVSLARSCAASCRFTISSGLAEERQPGSTFSLASSWQEILRKESSMFTRDKDVWLYP